MSKPARHKPGVIGMLLATTCIGRALYVTWPYVQVMPNGPGWTQLAWGLGAALALGGFSSACADVASAFGKAFRTFRTLRPKSSVPAAAWLTRAQARKAGLCRKSGLFLGIVEGKPLFIPNAVHGLVVAPARKGKTTSFVMPALAHDIGASRVVTDLKGELLAQLAEFIERYHGHQVIALNPAHKFGFENTPYNPVQIIIDDYEHAPEDVMADARSMVLQIYPEAPGGDRDPYWPEGTRKLLVFVIVALVVLRAAEEAHLPRAYEVLCDDDLLRPLITEALDSDVLAGELRMLAKNITKTWDENPKHEASFCEGAVQRLAPYGPSGRLAASMQSCGFRFRDLKRRKMTVFLVCDYTRMDDFAPWIGLLNWSALTELVREDNDIPVHFILDEFTNYKLSGLPNALTALGGYGVHCWMVVQELQEIARVYGKEALATILSQTDVKQFFGVGSHETAQLVSRMLGEEEVTAESFNLGHDVFDASGLSLSRRARSLLTPDQVRRLPDDELIAFIKNLPPIRALKVGYQEIYPWCVLVQPNPLYGGEPFLGEVKMHVSEQSAKATRAGTRKIQRPKRPLLRPLLAASVHLLPGLPALVVGAAALCVLGFGWPYLLIEYTRSHSWCRYVGPPLITMPVEKNGSGSCPLIIWKK